ncbi:MAG: DNA-binding domain-containing protein [Dokdonella sp.]
MTSLAATQRRMQVFLLHPKVDTDIANTVVATSAAGVDERLNVYALAYRARLKEVLHNDFPGLLLLSTAETFDEIAGEYIDAVPSRHANVRWYGGALAEFLRNDARWSMQPALAEMAAFEWNLGLAFDAETEPSIEVARLGAVPAEEWPALRLTLGKSLRRMALHWNVGAVRRATDLGEASPALAMLEPSQPWIIWRKGVGVRHRRLEDDEAIALDIVERNGSFTEICEALVELHALDAVAMRTASLLRHWVDDEWIVGISSAT